MIKTAICDLLGIKHPIIQGGMAHIATAELASAVSNAGGFGIIGSGNAPPEWVREQIQQTRKMTDKPFGVNILLISPYAREVIQVTLEERVKAVTTGAGNPGAYLPAFKRAGIKVMPVVASVALAVRLERIGVDAIIAEGMESGGEVGETTTMAIVPQVVDAVHIPVIAAGGIADGRGLAAALTLGAQGVQMGTRFVASTECIAHSKYKEKLIKARDRSTVVTGRSVGYPMRCLANKFTRRLQEMEKDCVPKEEFDTLGRGRVRLGLIEGDLNEGTLIAGQIASMIKEVAPVRKIIEDMVVQAERVLSQSKNLCTES
ncbi:MAG: enoyl-[acyl-carrier-protein] reductase FabK [Chloroflexota bacterium]